MIKELNPSLKLVPVVTDGYSARDLSGQYYCGVILLIKHDSDGWEVGYCRGYDEQGFHFSGKDEPLPASKLFRFIPESGFYEHPNSGVFRFDYTVRKTYRKGLSAQHVSFSSLEGKRISMSSSTMLRFVDCMVKPHPEISGESFVISRRLCVSNGKLITYYKNLTVGDYKQGVVSTPIAAIVDRISDLTYGDLACQLR